MAAAVSYKESLFTGKSVNPEKWKTCTNCGPYYGSFEIIYVDIIQKKSKNEYVYGKNYILGCAHTSE